MVDRYFGFFMYYFGGDEVVYMWNIIDDNKLFNNFFNWFKILELIKLVIIWDDFLIDLEKNI